MSEAFKPVVRFTVVSDIHLKDYESVEDKRFAKAIQKSYEIAQNNDFYKNLDAFVIVGDFADSGSIAQYEKAKAIIDSNIDSEKTQVIASIASHETNNPGVEEAYRRFETIMGLSVDTHAEINGFHFISVSPSHKVNFDDNKQKWVAENLAKASEKDSKKPIFVFQHPHNQCTVYGSILWGESELIPIYMNYPQIIDFSGHSHAPINDPRSIHQQHFTSLGTGTLSYFELDEFDKISSTFPEKERDKAAQMLIVEADAENRVRIYPYDLITDNYFPYVWKIDTPSDTASFIYTNERYRNPVYPYFTDDMKISFSNVTENGFTVEFPQAKIDEDYVNSYDIIVKNNAGDVVKCLSIWSDYYFYDMPKTKSAEINSLKSNKEYTVEIRANGFWFNSSKNNLIAKITTK